MPTGYTCDIKDGISFKKFIMGCAHAFGALIEMRDDSIDTPIPEFKVSDYHTKELTKAEKQLRLLKGMTKKQLGANSKADYEQEREYNQRSIIKADKLRVKYDEMLEHVRNWIPPTFGHRELKHFMFEQLKRSLDQDCDTKYWKKNMPTLLSGDDWYAKQMKEFEWSINYHTEEQQKEVERVTERNSWVNALRRSIK